MARWYLVFDGSSVDGRGSPEFVKRTTCKSEAREYYERIRDNFYSTGKVMIANDFKYWQATARDFE